jgi:hypothetical protein
MAVEPSQLLLQLVPESGQNVNLSTSVYLVPKIRMQGAFSPVPDAFPWRGTSV